MTGIAGVVLVIREGARRSADAPRRPAIVNRPQEQFDRTAADVPSVFDPLLDRTAEVNADQDA